MKKFFLIGSDINNSLSPKIHSTIYNEYEIKATYNLFKIQSIDEVKNLLTIADGFNVTAPFKQQIIPFLKHDYAKINSVNTVVMHDLSGHSTDGKGFILDAKRLRLDLSRVYIIGKGGAAKSIMQELNKIENKIFVHDKEKDVRSEVEKIKPSLIINATPVKFNLDNVYDLKYNDYQGISGIGMLIYQAILSAELFLGIKIDLDIFSKILGDIK